MAEILTLFERCPWRSFEAEELRDTKAYTFLEERQLGAWLGMEFYTGKGEIIDAGAFFGGSALSFAVGLARNQKVAQHDKIGRIHSFDTFEWAAWINPEFLPENVEFGRSFLNRYHDTVRKHETMIAIHPGDITKQRWRGGRIEILFVDCAKSFAANTAIITMFFPWLLPGSIVVQQDYAVLSRLVWIHATMEFFANHFRYLGCTRAGGSTAFLLEKLVTARDVIACRDALKTECVPLARKAADRFVASDRQRAAILTSIEKFQESPLAI